MTKAKSHSACNSRMIRSLSARQNNELASPASLQGVYIKVRKVHIEVRKIN